MSNLLAKRYKNNKAKAPVIAEEGKKMSGKQKVEDNNNFVKDVKTETVKVMKETKTLMLD